MLGEGPTDDINGGFGGAEKKFCINFGKAKSIFCLSLHDNHDNSLCLLTEKKSIYKFKANNTIVNFPTQFGLWTISSKFDAAESREICLKRKCV